MPAFCFTAPVLTESEEKAAREALSPQEHEQIRQDMYGHTSSAASQQYDDGRGMQIMLEAIETSIPISEKEAYLKAVCVCPHLVERESSFWVFLRCENHDPWAAAQRLVQYWTLRRQIFGPEKAYLPLTLDGAMADDIQYLQKGFVYTLPSDQHGRPVVFIDRVRVNAKVVPRECFARCVFFVACMASTQVNRDRGKAAVGIVYLVNCRVRAKESQFSHLIDGCLRADVFIRCFRRVMTCINTLIVLSPRLHSKFLLLYLVDS
jgi:hypothetical protein